MAAVGIPSLSEVVNSNSVVSAASYGVMLDARYFTDGTITSGNLSQFTSATGNFTSADNNKTLTVSGAGAGGNALITTVTFVSSTTLTLTTAATAAVANAYCALGTENTAALQAALNACATSSRTFTSAATITTGTNSLSISGGNLTADDVGSFIRVQGAGVSGADAYDVITAVASATSCTLANNAGTTANGTTCAIMKSGGTCFLPGGNGLYTGSLYVPPHVTLQGTYQTAPSHYGTNLYGVNLPPQSGGSAMWVCGGSGSGSGTSFLNLFHDAAKAAGICFFYPNQPQIGTGAGTPIAYPWTVSFQQFNSTILGANAALENCELVNCYQGILIENHQRPRIKNVFGQAYFRGLLIDNCRDTSHVEDISFSVDWDNTGSPSFLAPSWCQTNSQAYWFGRIDEGYLHQCFCYGYWQAFVFNSSSISTGTSWMCLTQCGADVCSYGIVANQSQDFGVRLVNCDFTTIGGAVGTGPLVVGSGFTGTLCLSNCLLVGASSGAISIAGGGQVSLDNCKFESANVTVTGGNVQITNCRFPSGGANVITLSSAVLTAIVTNNRLGPSGTISNGMTDSTKYMVTPNLNN